MKIRLLLFCVLSTLGLTLDTACAAPEMGVAQLSEFENQKISALHVTGEFTVNLKQGNETGISLKIDERLQPYLACELADGRLTLEFRNLPDHLLTSEKWNYQPEVTLTVTELVDLKLAGGAQINASGDFTGSKLMVNCSSSGIDGLSWRGRGESRMRISGNSQLKKTTIAGSSRLDIQMSGNSTMDITSRATSFKLQISGSARITAAGTANIMETRSSGSAYVDLGELNTRTATVKAGGSSSVYCWVIEKLTAETSSQGTIRYKHGSLRLTVSRAVSGSITTF